MDAYFGQRADATLLQPGNRRRRDRKSDLEQLFDEQLFRRRVVRQLEPYYGRLLLRSRTAADQIRGAALPLASAAGSHHGVTPRFLSRINSRVCTSPGIGRRVPPRVFPQISIENTCST